MIISLNHAFESGTNKKTLSSCPDCIQDEFNSISLRERRRFLSEIRRDIKANELEAIKTADA